MCLVYPGVRSEAVEEIGMRAVFDSLGDVELVTQCRYQAPKTLQEDTETAQRVEGCRLASEASTRPDRRTQLTSARQEAPLEPTTSFTPEDFVRACHAVAGRRPPPYPRLAHPGMPPLIGRPWLTRQEVSQRRLGIGGIRPYRRA